MRRPHVLTHFIHSTPSIYTPQKATGLIRGNYRCRLCGGMKKNHNCPLLYDSAEKREMATEVSCC
jgi:hypothetical protein